MYRKFNTTRARVVRMRNKSRSPSRFISALRASFVPRCDYPTFAPRGSPEGKGGGGWREERRDGDRRRNRRTARRPHPLARRNKSRQTHRQTSRYYYYYYTAAAAASVSSARPFSRRRYKSTSRFQSHPRTETPEYATPVSPYATGAHGYRPTSFGDRKQILPESHVARPVVESFSAFKTSRPGTVCPFYPETE